MFRAFDFGGSGLRSAAFSLSSSGEPRREGAVQALGHPPWECLGTWLAERVDIREDVLAFATAGFVDSDAGIVRGWAGADRLETRPVRRELEESFNKPAVVLNDGEAHLMAHRDIWLHPQICVSLGTVVGFAWTDEAGTLLRPRGASSFDLGEMALPTRASQRKVYWALGNEGLRELETTMGADAGKVHFGYRLGSFLATLGSIFQPRTIVLSGGIIASSWSLLRRTTLEAFASDRPFWLEDVELVPSPYGAEAALVGAVKYAARRGKLLMATV